MKSSPLWITGLGACRDRPLRSIVTRRAGIANSLDLGSCVIRLGAEARSARRRPHSGIGRLGTPLRLRRTAVHASASPAEKAVARL